MHHILLVPQIHTYLHCVYLLQMSSHVSKTRANHTNNIRDEILTYLKPSDSTTYTFEIPANLPKDKRGMENHVTARFLIPRRHLDEYEAGQQR